MKKFFYIFIFLLPLITIGQIVPFGFMQADCTPVPGEINVGPDATADPNCNESTAIGYVGNFSTSKALESTTTYEGSYSVKLTAPVSTAISYGQIDIDLDATYGVGDQFAVSFWYYIPSSNTASTSIGFLRLTHISGSTATTSPTEDAWTEFAGTYEINATGNAWIRLFTDDLATNAGDGNVIYVDNISVVKTN